MRICPSKNLLIPTLALILSVVVDATPQTKHINMQLIPEGQFRPLYTNPELPDSRKIPSFWLDENAVTNLEFLEFVTANPKWQRSQVSSLFADENYLKHWASDLDLGPRSELLADLPVVNVSWYAARAYAKWVGKRLPSQAEWEYVALASETSTDGRDQAGHYQRILDWYSRPNQDFSKWEGRAYQNVYGVYDLHGLVWEWVEDFNTNLSTGESRADSSLDRKFFCGSTSIGASDFKDYAAFMRYGYRSSLKAAYTSQNLGFRCARDSKPKTSNP